MKKLKDQMKGVDVKEKDIQNDESLIPDQKNKNLHKNRTHKKNKNSRKDNKEYNKFIKRIIRITAGLLVLTAIIIGILVFLGYQSQKQKNEELRQHPELIIEEIPAADNPVVQLGESVLDHIIKAGQAVVDALDSRPPSYDLSDVNHDNFADIESCLIDGETGKVDITVSSEGLLASDDKYYYLFALDTYTTQLTQEDEYIVKEYKDKEVSFSVNLNYKQAGSRLFKKFIVAVKLNGTYVPVSVPHYINNPEAIAKYTGDFPVAASKKGLLVDPNRLRGSELDELGVKQAAYNIPVARLLGSSTNPAYPNVSYQYNGKTYQFNGQIVAEYDLVFGTLTAKGIITTAIILNNYSPAYPQLIHPLARSGSTAPYYAFNAAEEGGVEYIAAIASFLAERYSGNTGHGKVYSWIIANEINARKEWNYMERVDEETYVEEYAKAFRIFYNAIKSVTANAKVYISLDQQWDRNLKNNPNYDARDIMDEFNRNISSKGNIDWGVALHPYSVPLTISQFWVPTKYVNHTASTPMMTMDNISVLTDYLQQPHFLTESGEVRSITLSELGYPSQSGEAMQAAAYAYAYYIIANNQHIDAFLLNRQTDAAEEVSQGLAFGLNGLDGHRKQIFNVFKYIDTPEHEKYTEFAKSIIGISDWNEVITKR